MREIHKHLILNRVIALVYYQIFISIYSWYYKGLLDPIKTDWVPYIFFHHFIVTISGFGDSELYFLDYSADEGITLRFPFSEHFRLWSYETISLFQMLLIGVLDRFDADSVIHSTQILNSFGNCSNFDFT